MGKREVATLLRVGSTPTGISRICSYSVIGNTRDYESFNLGSSPGRSTKIRLCSLMAECWLLTPMTGVRFPVGLPKIKDMYAQTYWHRSY